MCRQPRPSHLSWVSSHLQWGHLPCLGGKHSFLPFSVEAQWAPAVEEHWLLFAGQPAVTR